jgi:hypothetical protein
VARQRSHRVDRAVHRLYRGERGVGSPLPFQRRPVLADNAGVRPVERDLERYLGEDGEAGQHEQPCLRHADEFPGRDQARHRAQAGGEDGECGQSGGEREQALERQMCPAVDARPDSSKCELGVADGVWVHVATEQIQDQEHRGERAQPLKKTD